MYVVFGIGVHIYYLHIQTPPTDYVDLILRSTAMATASRSTIESTLQLLDAQ